ncbi:DEAD/DEAH box helicase [Mesorhizobium sp. M0761]|uniref:DEAD/DEAH box helicase n=1 Tax=Mesorhizobium sp. M0761 TaxID=2956994 RepID=UPI0033378529
METLVPVVNCWIKRTDNGKLGRVVEQLSNGHIRVEFGPNNPTTVIEPENWSCGIMPGFIVQDAPLSASRQTLGVGTVVAVRTIVGMEQVSVQFHASGEMRWIPFERLARIMDPKLQFMRGEQRFLDSAERTSLNLMAYALRTWNQATGALDRLDVDPLPHQITLVHRILSSGDTNWLIADDVGLGKTIEVGLLLGALERRQNLRRILIVVPSGLTRQWKDEMLTKFDRQFRIYGRDFEVETPAEWGLYERVIVSLDLAKPKNADDVGGDFSTRFGSILSAGKWDIVIFDEAHRLSRDESGRTTLRFKLARALRERCDSVLLLTGTPHQGDVGKFQNLLKLVRPAMAESIDRLDEDPTIVSDIVLRNRKIDVVDADGHFIFHGVLVRRSEIPSGPETLELERRLSQYLRRGYRAGDIVGGTSGRAIGFVMTIYRKLASSSVWALYVALTKRRQRILGEAPIGPAQFDLDEETQTEVGEDEDNLAELDLGGSGGVFFADEMQDIESVLSQAKLCFSVDRKFFELEKLIFDLVKVQKKKLLIFTEYRATQNYLLTRIKTAIGTLPAQIHGGMSVDEKQAAIAAFEENVEILISTEAGGEGLNLQRNCHVMVNYDLPWNPARLQQRIGRLYRYGQTEKVIVINLAARDTIDNLVLTTVLERLEAVIRQMGPVSSEYDERHQSEVLGDLLERLDINELLDEARTGGVERTAERVDSAIERARESKSLQDDILANISTMAGDSWRQLGSFSTLDLANFVKRASALCEIEVTDFGNPERFDIRLPESLKGKFPEFGNRTFIEVRTARADGTRISNRLLLDFSSPFVRFLVDTVTRPEFGGGYGVIAGESSGQLIAAMLIHYQNEQGEPRGIDLLVGIKGEAADIVVDNSQLRPLFEGYQRPGMPQPADPSERKAAVEAIFDRIEVEAARASEISRHASGLFPIGILEYQLRTEVEH